MSHLRTKPTPADRDSFRDLFLAVRAATEELAAPLLPEDQVVQSMADVSPTKWHLAHASWFFETFVLIPHQPGYAPFDPHYGFLFNSYYDAVGPRHARPDRGLLSRPSVAEVGRYRDHVTRAVEAMIVHADDAAFAAIEPLLTLGMHHEQQHQELILMDIKHVFSCNPTAPVYRARPIVLQPEPGPSRMIEFPGGLVEIGHDGAGFAFDNELPRHRSWLEPFRLAARPVTVGEYLGFIEDGGYRRPELWLSDGRAVAVQSGWTAPLYWRGAEADRQVFTLAGTRPVDRAEPVCHVSFYEADAFARWAGKRLPTEAEWEVAAGDVPVEGNFADAGTFHPRPAPIGKAPRLQQIFGDVWEWTARPYGAYPGYRAAAGAIGEYNGKFMCNQMVLRGGSAVTPPGHVRASYRNFFPLAARWAFAGLRLAEDA